MVGYVLLLAKEESITGLRKAIMPLSMCGVVLGAYGFGRHLALEGIGHSPFQIGMVPLVLTWPSLLWFYVGHLVWPVGLSVLYDRLPVLHADGRHFWLPLLGIVALTVVVAAMVRKDQRRLTLFAAILFMAPLLPAFILPAILPADYAHDRYLYLPCFGFALLVGIVLKKSRWETQARVPVLATIAIVLGLSAATSAQMIYWANDLLLFDRATRISPGNLTAFDNLAQALVVRGRSNEAVSIFRQVLHVDPNNWPALYNLGLSDFLAGNYQEAEGYLRRATDDNTSDSDTAALLADTLNHVGKYAEAEVEIRRALALRPNKLGYRKVLATALEGQGKVSEARKEIRPEMESIPSTSQ